MAWGSKTTSTQLTTISTEQFFSQTPSLLPGESAHVQLSVDFVATPTDNAVVSIYGTLDASTEDWDEIPYQSFTIDNSEDASDISFVVTGVYKFRVGVKRDGSTDTLTSADMSHRLDGISL